MSRDRLSSALSTAAIVLGATVLATVVGLVPWSIAAPQPSTNDDSVRCVDVDVPVRLLPTDAPDAYSIAAQLCAPNGPGPRTAQVLVHGATYDRWYWDPSYQREQYSYARFAARRGYAVLLLDRIGAGRSSHPAPELVTVKSSAYAVHQVIQALRHGKFATMAYDQVVLVGHSVGSAVTINESATYQDVDAVVVTGLTHQANVGAPLALGSVWPAFVDPVIGRALPPGYLTTRPGTRPGLFYALANADPGLIAADEQAKDTITDAEGATFFPSLLASTRVRVPTLLAIGDRDLLFCIAGNCANAQALVRTEQPFYPNVPCLDGYVLPAVGHNLNLHRTSTAWFEASVRWIERRIGVDRSRPALEPC